MRKRKQEQAAGIRTSEGLMPLFVPEVTESRQAQAPGTKKSEIVTFRLDPKLKYLAELAARKQRRSLSSYVEHVVQASLNDVKVDLIVRDREEPAGLVAVEYKNFEPLSLIDAARVFRLWDSDESDRVVRLGVCFPDLLTHDEQKICKLVRENDFVWKGEFQKWPPTRRWAALIEEETIDWALLRDCWLIFRDVAQGVRPPSELPGHKKSPPRQRG